ncbi:MAG: hypothetical protein ACFNTM_02450, partial [Cardiobacterium sp.]
RELRNGPADTCAGDAAAEHTANLFPPPASPPRLRFMRCVISAFSAAPSRGERINDLQQFLHSLNQYIKAVRDIFSLHQ